MVSHRRAVLKKCEWRDSKKHGLIGSHILADTSQCSSAKRQVDNPLTADRLRVRLLTDSVRLGTGIRTRHRHTNKMAAYMVSSSLSARQGYAPSARLAARAGASPVAVRAPLAVVAKQSRIGKHPVPVPKGVTYTLKDNHLSVKVRPKSLACISLWVMNIMAMSPNSFTFFIVLKTSNCCFCPRAEVGSSRIRTLAPK